MQIVDSVVAYMKLQISKVTTKENIEKNSL